MRVCVISPFMDDGSSTKATSPATGQDILDFIALVCNDYDFIVLAGYITNSYPNANDVRNELLKKKSSATVFIETGGIQPQNYSPSNNAFFVSASNTKHMPEQIFSKPKGIEPTRGDILALQTNLPRRFHTISNKEVLLFICGEIDAFTIHNNTTHHGVLLSWQGADIIINPTFTIRGHWNHLGLKLSNLSRNKKIVIHNANNQKNHSEKSQIIANIKVFFDGDELDIKHHHRIIDITHKLTWSSFESKENAQHLRNLQFFRVDKNHQTTKDLIFKKRYKEN